MREKPDGADRPAKAWWRELTIVACALVVSVALLIVFHAAGDPAWVRRELAPAPGSAAAIWQVQTTFLSVGFAGLTIAAQLFAEAPLAIGTSRKRVLSYIGASWFVTVGLAGNAVMGLASIWLPSATAVVIAFAWLTATAVLLMVSTSRLTQLFGHPSRLDDVVRSSLIETLSDRFDRMARRYSDARSGVEDLLTADSTRTSTRAVSTLHVPAPQAGRVIRAIDPESVRRAIASLGPSAGAPGDDPPRILLDIRPGDRTRLGATAFRIETSARLDAAEAGRLVELLQSSIELEPPEAVTAYEETEHEIATLVDAIGTNLRSGALATAERALELLGEIVQGVWMAGLERADASEGASLSRGSGLLESIDDVEQDVLLSPQVAQVFVTATTTRTLEAARSGAGDYIDECLRSFMRQWSDILNHGGPEFDPLPVRIVASVRNLTLYADTSADEPNGLRSRGTWAMVELVKLALDAERPDIAKLAAEELRGLFELDPDGSARSEVRAGLLVLSGWLRYLGEMDDRRYTPDPDFAAVLVADGSGADILAARSVVEAGTPFSRWDRWETKSTASGSVSSSELPDFIDRAQAELGPEAQPK
ncbi:hypothetical protein P5G50_17930 [Leifsonia sp. F6_8S_P_1B]|uniref:DUF2254 domain-containing protein n=1 Tax=Leifsonia williamsii TaxID=3035919 RepID=A0ABT8KGM5_9MICO|nr:hypothetical protein [Leifsonia williamsii]MDN4616332.1 hypothetical protein [Leifsonia williamsii]